jgi:type IV pilus assembly protein PilE
MKRLQRFDVRHVARGFTLVELMVTVMIVGILASVAYPAYRSHIVKTHRNAAKACLSQYAQFMERFYTTNLTYVGADPSTLACTTDGNMSQRYTFSPGTPTASTYTVSATPVGSQLSSDTKCGTLSVTQSGSRSASGTGGASACW